MPSHCGCGIGVGSDQPQSCPCGPTGPAFVRPDLPTWPRLLPVYDPHEPPVRPCVWPRRPGHPSRPRRLMRPTRPGHHIQSWGITHAEGGSRWYFRFLGTSIFGHFSVPGIDIRTHRVELRRAASVSHAFDPNTHRFGLFPSGLPRHRFPSVVMYRIYRLAVDVHFQYTPIGCDGRTAWLHCDFQYRVDTYTCKNIRPTRTRSWHADGTQPMPIIKAHEANPTRLVR